MRRGWGGSLSRVVGVSVVVLAAYGCGSNDDHQALDPRQVADGKQIFRFDTFGDEQLWTDQLQINQVIEGAISPKTALAVGLKVDVDALPAGILDHADLDAPA